MAKAEAEAEADYVEPPRSIVMAAKLMYAGAALTALEIIAYTVYIATTHSIADAVPHATAAKVHATKTTLITANAFAGLIEIGLWIFIARANRAGLSWARIAASVLAAINTILLVTALAGGGAATRQVFTVLTWLIGAGAVSLLWRRESGDYFSTPTAPASSAPSAESTGSTEPASGSGKAGGS